MRFPSDKGTLTSSAVGRDARDVEPADIVERDVLVHATRDRTRADESVAKVVIGDNEDQIVRGIRLELHIERGARGVPELDHICAQREQYTFRQKAK